MSKERAFVRYTKAGKIVPGSLILTSGSYPSGPGLYKEITTDLCCEENNNTMNYKVYTAILYQDGATTDPPTVTVLENTLGVTASFVYSAVGRYTIDLGLGPIDETKTFCQITLDPNTNAYLGFIGPESDLPANNNIRVATYDTDENNVELGGFAFIEIRVYP